MKTAGTRSVLAVVLVTLGLDSLFVVLGLRWAEDGDPGSAANLTGIVSSSFSGFLAPCLAVAVAAGEYRHRTIRTAALLCPSRGRLLAARLVAAGAFGAGLALACAALLLSTATVWSLATGHGAADLGGAVLADVGREVLVTTLLSVLGSAIGAAVRSQAIGLSMFLLWLLFVDPLLLVLADRVPALNGAGRYLIDQVTAAVSDPSRPGLLPVWAAAAVLAGYVAALAGAALVSGRRDLA